MKIVMVTSECVPFAKTGGLADVVGALAPVLKKMGHEVIVIMPKYGSIRSEEYGISPFLDTLGVWMGENTLEWCRVLRGFLPEQVPVYFIEFDAYFQRDGLYHDKAMNDYNDNPRRFAFLCRAALQFCIDTGFEADVIHAHDWQAALCLMYLKVWHWNDPVIGKASGILTIHNIAYQGKYDKKDYEYTGLRWDNFTSDKIEDHGAMNYLKAGIQYADMVTTVSPTYAKETKTPEFGYGLAPYLNDKGDRYTGILNGADYSEWNPEIDRLLPARFSTDDMRGKGICKEKLQEVFGLEQNPAIPVFGIVSRFAEQKGLDIFAAVVEGMLGQMVCQVVVVGSGDKSLEAFYGTLPARFPGKAGSYIGYSNELAHLVEAGSDFFVMPSRYEPCGLNQIYSLRYGTLPIVHATGGLEDTVIQYNEKTGAGTGFKFFDETSAALYYTLGWAVSTWFDRKNHIEKMRAEAMGERFTWEESARKYVKVFKNAHHFTIPVSSGAVGENHERLCSVLSDSPRRSGLLLHPVSLPGAYECGQFGKEAYAFIDFLAASGQSLWQILPLTPADFNGCPYNSYSAFAGYDLLVSAEKLQEDGYIKDASRYRKKQGPSRINYQTAAKTQREMLEEVFSHFEKKDVNCTEFRAFCDNNAMWLDDFALFCALKESFSGKPWYEWPEEFKLRNKKKLADFADKNKRKVHYIKMAQWLFYTQWAEIKRYAHKNGVQIIGDIPIFVAYDSADVWAHQDIFLLKGGKLAVMAGVPPDYFSPTGQLWGNPLYDWDVLDETGFNWWLDRFKAALSLYDIVRIDHFRGFAGCWAVPAGAETAIQGCWLPVPGGQLFQILEKQLGKVPVIAEDLGEITHEVTDLMKKFGFPGMKVLQFAFGDTVKNSFLPFNYSSSDCVVYTGTHDNDTSVGWFERLSEKEKKTVISYLGDHADKNIADAMIDYAFSSTAKLAIIPLQDLLGLASEARFNIPGTVSSDNWTWRFEEGMLTKHHREVLRSKTEKFNRLSSI